MTYYTKNEIAQMIEQRGTMIMVPEQFHHAIRLELKWAYVGLLNILLDEPQFNENLEAYFIENRPLMMKMLETLMNKKVDDDKLNKYLNELVEEDLLDIQEQAYYLKK